MWLLAGAAHAATYTIAAGVGNQTVYQPNVVTIQAGDTIRFINAGGYHNVSSDDHLFRCSNGCDGDVFGDGSPSTNAWQAQVRFNQPGTYGFHCEPHGSPGQGMFGTIIVSPTPVWLEAFSVD